MKKFISLDIEKANNFHNSICSIGLVIIENGAVIERKEWLVQPPGNKYNSIHKQIHGIDEDKTIDAPKFNEIWPELRKYLINSNVVAHNANVEKNAIEKTLDFYQLENININFICTYNISKSIFSYIKNYKLETLCGLLGIGFESNLFHSALYDAEKCAEIFIKLLDYVDFDEESWFPKFPEKKIKSKSGFSAEKIEEFTSNKISKELRSFNDEIQDTTHYFYDKNILITGTFDLFPKRNDLAQVVFEKGGINMSGITKKTNLIILGKNPGPSKMVKIKEMGIEVITESELSKFL